jgi:2-amino-4-hydroxy-6-hydroxymethyldihydropteridine diphosphokinase
VNFVRAYVGLGANLGEREATLREALTRLSELDGVAVVAVSSFRETDPVGNADQPRFVNAAAELETSLGPRELLDRLLEVERSLGRDRSREERWGPRTVDLDLLLYGDETVGEPGLEVPHPRLAERTFVLEPLVELDPGLRLPDGRALRDLHPPELE